jgi:hypothetical protein
VVEEELDNTSAHNPKLSGLDLLMKRAAFLISLLFFMKRRKTFFLRKKVLFRKNAIDHLGRL